ncbi:MAG TPA: ribonuclease D [Steroidobacteraceae bacterium]|jgi:ribonuclease D
MPDAIWIDRSDELPALADKLSTHERIGVDTEFLRERTFFPKLCLLQLSAGDEIWCIDTLRVGSLAPLMGPLTAPSSHKLVHAARQDLEALYLVEKKVLSPIFDTQIAAACVGLKPQIGYAELVMTLLEVNLPKGQTRTDWSKRPLTREQLAYAADDVRYLGEVAAKLTEQLTRLGRLEWARQDCQALEALELYEPDVSKSWQRMRGIGNLAAAARGRAKAIAVWRERLARERDLPRSWILDDAALFAVAHAAPKSPAALESIKPLNARFAASLLETLAAATEDSDDAPPMDLRPTPEQKALIDRLNKVVDARAKELQLSSEVLAPRGEIKSIALGNRTSPALSGWRADEIGTRLLAALPEAA